VNRPSTLLAAALLLQSTAFAFAADRPKAPFEVVVATPEGAPVEGADVAVTSAVTEPPYAFAGKTDATGKVTGELADFKSAYTIKVSKDGFQNFTQEIDLVDSKLKKKETATFKVSLPPITAVEYFNEGAKALREKDLPTATARFNRAIAADPKLAKAYSVLALIELEQKMWDKALAHADQALALDPTDMGSLRSRYDALVGAGDKEKAEAVLTELATKDRTPDTARLLYNAGAQAGNAQEVATARTRFAEALAIDPTLHQAHSALAELAIKEKNYPEAITELDLAIAAAPRNFKAYERKIEVQKAMGDKAGADATEKKLASLKAGG
jgi:tetratricopeptide (TPR) repeat protein